MIFFLSYFTILMTSAILDHPKEDTKTYAVKVIQDELQVTGKGDSPLWKNANELTDFIYPWENEKPPLISFKALHSRGCDQQVVLAPAWTLEK